MPKPPVTPGAVRSANGTAGDPTPDTEAVHVSLEVTPRKSRRRFTAAEKVRLLKAADAAIASGERGALEAFMRKEGLYSSHLASWRATLAAQGAQGLAAKKPGRKPKLDSTERQLLAAHKENARLKHKLAVANAVIGLQKKAHQVLGLTLPDLGELEEPEES